VISALVLLGAVGFTLVAAYQWAGMASASLLTIRDAEIFKDHAGAGLL
jgi:hypothetical protein